MTGDQQQMQAVMTRLKRAQGQIGGIVRMMEEGRSCAEVVTQIAAVSKALDRAGFAIIATGLRECAAHTEDGQAAVQWEELEKLFLSLA